MAIAVHKKNPKMFKEYRKCQREDLPADPIDRIIVGAVSIYESEDDVPKAELVQIVGLVKTFVIDAKYYKTEQIPGANMTGRQFVIQNWLGFLGSVSPHVMDTSLMGNVRLHITLTTLQILVANAAMTGAAFALSNIFFSVDTIDINDGMLKIYRVQIYSANHLTSPLPPSGLNPDWNDSYY
jgi:hypothetical protein